ncbi:MAG: acyl-CoA dehydrogenase family protein [Alphaproteobacteria bacterium]
MDFKFSDEQAAIFAGVARICAAYDRRYWRQCDGDGRFPDEFFRDIAKAGLLGIMMPPDYGGAGLGLVEAARIVQIIAETGGGWTATSSMHSYIFAPHPLVVHGSDAQRRDWLVPLLKGEHRAAFGVTEPDAGLDTTRLRTFARRDGSDYVIRGRKIWTTGALRANKILLIARTTPVEATHRPMDGLSLFYTDLDRSRIEVRAIPKLGLSANASCQLFIDDLRVPQSHRIGDEGKGFSYLLDGLNPERVLVAAEAIGVGRAALDLATAYAKDRVVFGRPIGQNQAIQHPLAQCWANLEAADLMTFKAASAYDAREPCGPHANAAKLLAADAGLQACETAIMTHGGMGYAKEFDVERLFREIFIPRLAPVSKQLILCFLAERVLGLPKSY